MSGIRAGHRRPDVTQVRLHVRPVVGVLGGVDPGQQLDRPARAVGGRHQRRSRRPACPARPGPRPSSVESTRSSTVRNGSTANVAIPVRFEAEPAEQRVVRAVRRAMPRSRRRGADRPSRPGGRPTSRAGRPPGCPRRTSIRSGAASRASYTPRWSGRRRRAGDSAPGSASDESAKTRASGPSVDEEPRDRAGSSIAVTGVRGW